MKIIKIIKISLLIIISFVFILSFQFIQNPSDTKQILSTTKADEGGKDFIEVISRYEDWEEYDVGDCFDYKIDGFVPEIFDSYYDILNTSCYDGQGNPVHVSGVGYQPDGEKLTLHICSPETDPSSGWYVRLRGWGNQDNSEIPETQTHQIPFSEWMDWDPATGKFKVPNTYYSFRNVEIHSESPPSSSNQLPTTFTFDTEFVYISTFVNPSIGEGYYLFIADVPEGGGGGGGTVDDLEDIPSPTLRGDTATPWEDLMGYVKSVVGFITIIAGVVAIIAIIWGGYLYITSMGDPSVANQGKNAVIGAVIGLVIASAAYAIVRWIELIL